MPPTHIDEGIVATRRIREFHPNVGILLLSQYVEPTYAMQLLEQHPERVRYLLKDRVSDGAVLVDALRRLTEGETVIDPTIVTRLLRRYREADPLDELSEREREVFGLVAQGLLGRSHRQAAVRHRAHRRMARQAHLPQAPDRREAEGNSSLGRSGRGVRRHPTVAAAPHAFATGSGWRSSWPAALTPVGFLAALAAGAEAVGLLPGFAIASEPEA